MKTKSRSGAVAVSMAALLGSLSLTLVALQDWYVDACDLSTVGALGFPAVDGLAFDPGTNTLYGTDVGTDQLLTIDTSTGAGTAVGALGFEAVNGLAFDPGTNTLYGTDGGTNQLLTIDTTTGAGTAVGAHGFNAVFGLAFDPGTNTLYGTDVGTDRLITIDVTTGAGTAVGALGFSSVNGLAFDPGTNTLYGTEIGTDQLILIDTSTGAGTAAFPLGFPSVRGLGLDPGTNTLHASDIATDQLIAIDVTTGTGTLMDPFCEIMDAVNAASDGDTIHIAPGTYFENVLLDKDLELIGTSGQAVTLLDGMASGSVVRVRDSAVTLTGLTLTNGTGTSYGAYSDAHGGGLFIYSPQDLGLPVSLIDCQVVGNSARHGGGIMNGGQYYAPYGNVPGGPLSLLRTAVNENSYDGIVSYEILDAFDSSIDANERHGVQAVAHLTLTNSTVSGNWNGGVITSEEATLTGTTVSGNGVSLSTDFSAGIMSFGGPLTLTSCTVSGNRGIAYWPIGSADAIPANGIWVHAEGSPVSLVNTTVTGNGIPGYGGASIVVASYFPDPADSLTLTLENSTVTGNTYGIAIQNPRDPGFGASFHVAVENSVLWNNGTKGEIYLTTYDTSSVTHTLIEGGWPGMGNLDADPLFVDPLDGNFRLMPGSPAIDAGDNLAVPMGVDTDIRGAPRIINGTVDMGAYEYFQRWRRANVPVPFAPPRIIR